MWSAMSNGKGTAVCLPQHDRPKNRPGKSVQRDKLPPKFCSISSRVESESFYNNEYTLITKP